LNIACYTVDMIQPGGEIQHVGTTSFTINGEWRACGYPRVFCPPQLIVNTTLSRGVVINAHVWRQ